MTIAVSSPAPAQVAHADEVMYGFDISDEEAMHFLCSVIASGDLPSADRKDLVRLSLMRGVEEWDMLFECATSLRDQAVEAGGLVPDGELSVLPFLGQLLSGAPDRRQEGEEVESGGEAASRTTTNADQQLRGRISRFWDGGVGRVRTDSAAYFKHVGNVHSPLVAHRKKTPTADAQPATAGPTQVTPTHASKPSPDTTRAHKSPFFSTSTTPSPSPSPANNKNNNRKPRPPRGTISSLPIPPLTVPRFGLVQESLAERPFDLLVAVTFLIRTHGRTAIPVFHQLMERFPGPAPLAAADPRDIIELIRPLGLAEVRCAAIQRYARTWLDRPPNRTRRFALRNYPARGDGAHVRTGEVFGAEDGDGDENKLRQLPEGGGDAVQDARARAVGCAWEIGHLTTGPYALDSWRIFCRDALLGRADDWVGTGAGDGFQPEWMRVLPRDKELRACLKWMWMREGWAWDPETGDREPLREEMRRAVDEGRVGYDDRGRLVILEGGVTP